MIVVSILNHGSQWKVFYLGGYDEDTVNTLTMTTPYDITTAKSGVDAKVLTLFHDAGSVGDYRYGFGLIMMVLSFMRLGIIRIELNNLVYHRIDITTYFLMDIYLKFF